MTLLGTIFGYAMAGLGLFAAIVFLLGTAIGIGRSRFHLPKPCGGQDAYRDLSDLNHDQKMAGLDQPLNAIRVNHND